MSAPSEQSDFERRTAWAEEHDRQREERAEEVRAEHRQWAQAQMDREYRVQVDILSELRRIKAILAGDTIRSGAKSK